MIFVIWGENMGCLGLFCCSWRRGFQSGFQYKYFDVRPGRSLFLSALLGLQRCDSVLAERHVGDALSLSSCLLCKNLKSAPEILVRASFGLF